MSEGGRSTGHSTDRTGGSRAVTRGRKPQGARGHAGAAGGGIHAYADEPVRDPGRVRRVAGMFTRVLAMVFIPIVLLSSLAVGLGYFRLLQGPVSLPFLVEPVEKGISAELSGLTSRVADVVVALTKSGGLEFQLRNLNLLERDGGQVISAPYAAMELSHRALWTGQVVPARVELIEPRVFVSYSESSGLQLQFTAGGDERLSGAQGTQDKVIAPSPVPARRSGGATEAVAQRIDLASVMEQMAVAARRGQGATSYLREMGLRDATVVLDYEGRSSSWLVPQLLLDIDHRADRSVISASARIASNSGPWSLSVRAENSAQSEGMTALVTLRGLAPRIVGEAVPQLAMLRSISLPVDGDINVSVARDGSVVASDIALELGAGQVAMGDREPIAVSIDGGLINASYVASERRFLVKPSTVRWSDSSLTFVGGASLEAAGAAPNGQTGNLSERWRFDLRLQEGFLNAGDVGIPRLAIDAWGVTGTIAPSSGVLRVEQAALTAGGGTVSLSGEMDGGASPVASRFDGVIGEMPAATLKALWPKSVAPDARLWVGANVLDGRVETGNVKVSSGKYLAEDEPGRAANESRMTLSIEARDIVARVVPEFAPVNLPRALVRVENEDFEIAAPEGTIDLGEGRVVALKAGRFASSNEGDDQATGQAAFKIATDLAGSIALISHPALGIATKSDLVFNNGSGKVEGEFNVTIPLIADLQPGDLKVSGAAQLSDGRAKDLIGGFDAQGAKINFSLSDRAVEASGEVLLAGVPAKVNWQRIIGVPEDMQPPLRLTAVLDVADRKQLGIDTSQSVLGDVPIELTIKKIHEERPDVHLRADLTNSDLLLRNIAWRKPPGRAAFLEGNLVPGRKHASEITDLTVVGDDLAIRGWAGFDKKGQLVAFEFPEFSLSLVSRLNVVGSFGKGRIWDIAVEGQTYDARSFFRSLYSVGQISEDHPSEVKGQDGVDLSVKIDNVIGFQDVSLRQLDMKLAKRGGKLTELKARGVLDGGEPLAVELRDVAGQPRQLLADSTDAGQAFRLVGFYPNVQRGRVKLEVNLDGRGPAEKTGTLWVENFNILGDPVVADIVGSVDDSKPAIDGRGRTGQRMVRQVFPFDRMRAPFSVGHGQFVLEDAYLRGPIQGATVRGKVDYNRQVVNIGGTYVPAQGLNNAFGEIPLLGQILSGPRNEGIFGMTFAIQGPMSQPQVIVNPLSLVAPGIFREIFQLTPEAPKVLPRVEPRRSGPADRAVRSSSAPADARAGASRAGSTQGTNGGGWSSRTTNPSN